MVIRATLAPYATPSAGRSPFGVAFLSLHDIHGTISAKFLSPTAGTLTKVFQCVTSIRRKASFLIRWLGECLTRSPVCDAG